MKRYWWLFLFSTSVLLADQGSNENLETFYDEFLAEERCIVLESFEEPCEIPPPPPSPPPPSPPPPSPPPPSPPPPSPPPPSPPPPSPPPPSPPPPPPPPPTSLNPAPRRGLLPVVIANNTGLPADQVYVTLAGQQAATPITAYFFQLGTLGTMNPIEASSTTFSADYSYPLSALPVCSTGSDNYLVYVPALNGARFYFTINTPMYLQSADGGIISPPSYYESSDPNYYNLYESVEVTFYPEGGGSPPTIPWTASVNTTEVDAFGLPVSIGYYSYSPITPTAVTPLLQNPNAVPSGFGIPIGFSASGSPEGLTTREEIITSLVDGLISGDQTGQSVWPKLSLPFYTNPYDPSTPETYLRVISPKQGIDAGVFPADYLSNTIYGAGSDSFLTQLFNYYTGHSLYMAASGAAGSTVYQGVSSGSVGSQTLTFTGVSGPYKKETCILEQANVTALQMFSGTQAMTGSVEGAALGSQFGDAFTVGFLPSTIGSSSSNPMVVTSAFWQDTYIPDYYSKEYATIVTSGGPWMDLYAQLMHAAAVRSVLTGGTPNLNGVGLCYSYDYDDSLGVSGTITPANTTQYTQNPYLGITVGSIDTAIPDPYSDTNHYRLTFTFDAVGGRTLQYQQGDGIWKTATSGQQLPGYVISNSTNPFRIKYTNNQGTSEFIVYLYYQFMQPSGTYNNATDSIIKSSTFTVNSSSGTTPTSFTIALSP